MLQHMLITICLIQWSPDKSSVFGSSAEDGLLNIWDYEKVLSQLDCTLLLCCHEVNTYCQFLFAFVF